MSWFGTRISRSPLASVVVWCSGTGTLTWSSIAAAVAFPIALASVATAVNFMSRRLTG
jgi:hypothetical protein